MQRPSNFHARLHPEHDLEGDNNNAFAICGLSTGDGMKYYVWVTVVVAIIGLGCGGYAAFQLDHIHKFVGSEQDRKFRYLFLTMMAVNAATFSLATLLLVFGVLNENSKLCHAWIVVMTVLGVLWIFVLLYALFIGATLSVVLFAVTIFEIYPGYGIWITFHYAKWAQQKQEHQRRLHARQSNVIITRRSHASTSHPSHPRLPHEPHLHSDHQSYRSSQSHHHEPVKTSDHPVH